MIMTHPVWTVAVQHVDNDPVWTVAVQHVDADPVWTAAGRHRLVSPPDGGVVLV